MTTPGDLRVVDRRGIDRPKNGDTKPCAHCGATVEFSDRYRFEGQVVSAWVCDSPKCRARELVRSMLSPANLSDVSAPQPAKDLRAAARRAVIKARAVVGRSKKQMAKATLTTSRTAKLRLKRVL